jgi:iron complex transport system ATP-binding protein
VTTLSLRDVSLHYGDRCILSGVNADFSQGDFSCVIGRNGAGKSTLLRALAALTPYTGSITLDARELRAMSRSARARRISLLPQSRPVPAMDVETLIAHGRFPHMGFAKTLSPDDRRHILAAAEAAGVSSLLRRALASLSGGERQRVYLAMTLAQDADFILLDEPSVYLDMAHQLETFDLLRAIHARGKGVIMAIHDLPAAFSVSNRVYVVADGGLVTLGQADAVYQSTLIERTFGFMLEKNGGSREVYAYRVVKPQLTKPQLANPQITACGETRDS